MSKEENQKPLVDQFVFVLNAWDGKFFQGVITSVGRKYFYIQSLSSYHLVKVAINESERREYILFKNEQEYQDYRHQKELLKKVENFFSSYNKKAKERLTLEQLKTLQGWIETASLNS